MKRRPKQIFIGFLYLTFWISLGLGGYFLFWYQTPTCTDGKQNQNETGIDCGGICANVCLADIVTQDIRVDEVGVIPYTDTSVDLYASITNPNTKAALRGTTYTFEVLDSMQQVIAKKTGSVSLLPKESKTLVEISLTVPQSQAVTTRLTFTQPDWVAATTTMSPASLVVTGAQYQSITSGVGFGAALGLVTNNGEYDLRSVKVNVLLRDSNNQVLAVNSTVMNTLVSGEARDFRLVWPQAFSGQVSRVDVIPTVDLLADQAFIQQNFPGGVFQSLGGK